MADPVIRVRDVSKDFMLPHLLHTTIKSKVIHVFRGSRKIETQHALENINFDVQPGEFLGIVGRNGSGKSTLLKVLAHIYRPTSGTVEVRGRLVPFIELGVGFHPELTGRENVYLNGALLGFSTREIDTMYDDIVAFAELEDDILLIDEVLAVGDIAFQQKCYEHFRALKQAGTTIVFVTHDMKSMQEFCDRALLIEGRSILFEGSPTETAARYLELFA
jgi:ABC-2 type transport system ATP-binding protein